MSLPRYPKYKDSGVEWLGEVPEHWQVRRLKHVCEAFPSNVDKKSHEGEQPVLLCNYTDVYHNDQITADLQFMAATASPDQIEKFTLRASDTVITKDSETADDIAVSAYVPADLPGVVCGYHLSIVRPRISACGSFVKRLFDSAYIKATVAVKANGLTRVGLSQYDIDNIEWPWPPIQEQEAITTFIASETSKIDALISEQQRLVELLKEKRQAAISHAVTKGLNPAAPMKPSGIAWIGDVPASWQVRRLKDAVLALRGVQMGPFGGMLKELESSATPYKLYGQENTISNDFDSGSRWLSEARFLALQEYELRPGDVVLTRKGASIGNCRVVPKGISRGVIDSDTIRVRLDPEVLSTNFVVTLMHEGYLESAILEGQKGSVLPGLNTGTIANLKIAIPPLREQKDIVCFLDTRRSLYDGLISAAHRSADLLRERRAGLISAAVTGQVDVRSMTCDSLV